MVFINPGEQSNLELIKNEAFENLFNTLTKGEEELTTENMSTETIPKQILEDLNNMLIQIKANNLTVTKADFIEYMNNLYEYLSLNQRRNIIFSFRNKNTEKELGDTFRKRNSQTKPSFNNCKFFCQRIRVGIKPKTEYEKLYSGRQKNIKKSLASFFNRQYNNRACLEAGKDYSKVQEALKNAHFRALRRGKKLLRYQGIFTENCRI